LSYPEGRKMDLAAVNSRLRTIQCLVVLFPLLFAVGCGGAGAASVGSAASNSSPQSAAISISPAQAVLQIGASQQFTVAPAKAAAGVVWLVNGVQGGNPQSGTVTSSGLYTAPQAVPSGGAINVTARDAASDSATAAITIAKNPAKISITVSPTSSVVQADQSQQFSASVTGTTNHAVNWYVGGVQGGNASSGTISSTGLYTAPACPAVAAATVTATSVYDTSTSASATVTVSGSASAGRSNYYVATNGSDSNDGSFCHPWATISHAAGVVKAGSTVHVRSGTYAEAPSFNTSGTSQSRIRFISEAKWGAHVNPASADSVVTINGNYIDVVGFDVGGGQDRIGILDWGSYNHTYNNRVHDIIGDCSSAGGGGIVTANWNGTGARIVGNVVIRIGAPAGSCNKIQGIYHENVNGYIADNLVSNVAAYGLECAHYCQSSTFINNTVFHSGGGLWVGDTDNGQITSNIFGSNNIFYDIVPGVNFTSCGIREYPGTTGSGNQYVDNLIYATQYPLCLSTGTATGTVQASPQFVNYQADGSGNYQLQSSSPAINAGTSVNAPSRDIVGGNRPVGSAWDIGAYEYGATAATWPWQ